GGVLQRARREASHEPGQESASASPGEAALGAVQSGNGSASERCGNSKAQGAPERTTGPPHNLILTGCDMTHLGGVYGAGGRCCLCDSSPLRARIRQGGRGSD